MSFLLDYVHFCASSRIMYVKMPNLCIVYFVQTNDLRTKMAKSLAYVRKSPCKRERYPPKSTP